MPTEAFIALLIEALVKTMPSGMGAADREANLSIARTLFEAYRPADAKEAALAARAIAAHFAAMDGFARAARPGLSDDTAIRLRVSAIAASRLSDALTRPRQQPRPPVADTTVPRSPGAAADLVMPASRVRHRAGLPLPGVPDVGTLLGATALSPVRPTVPVPV
jgi:hypothetical protein